MNSNIVINNSQEKEINKILQDGIDKSLLYIQSLNVPNSNESFKYSTQPKKIKSNTIQNISNNKKLRKVNTLKKNSKQNLRPLSVSEKNIQKYYSTMPRQKSKSNNKIKTLKKKSRVFDYQLEYKKKKEELEKYKNELIQERIKQNKLQKEMNSKIKKEEEYKKIEDFNNTIKKNSDDLILKIQRSEKIREEQSKIIEGLLKEYNSMIKSLRNNPGVEIINKYNELEIEAEQLKYEGEIKNQNKKKKKKLSKKKIIKK
jgi:hypothetical protein